MAHDPAADTTPQVSPSTPGDDLPPVGEPAIPTGAPGFVSPQDFYRAAVQRADVRRILAVLAT